MIGQWCYYCIFFPFLVLWLPLFSFYCCCTRLERLVIARKGKCGRLLKESVCTSTTSRQTEKGRSHIGSTVVCWRDPVCDGHFFFFFIIYIIDTAPAGSHTGHASIRSQLGDYASTSQAVSHIGS